MPRGASFHLKPMTRPAAAHAHNTREWSSDHPEPGYLLPAEFRRGAWREIATADPREVHAAKMSLASGKARSMPEYSPVWEGVLNLEHPGEKHRDRARYGDQVRRFCERYEAITGHRVIAADVHLDEGRIENGHPVYNGHAHIAVDRTDEHGRPIQLNKTQLRQVQDLAATVTGLERGTDARETRRKHLPHQAWRGLARAGAVRSRDQIAEATGDRQALEGDLRATESGRQLAVAERDEARAAIATAELYGELRGLMKASGTATPETYQEARKHREDRGWLADQVETWSARVEAARKAQEAEKKAAEAARTTSVPLIQVPTLIASLPALEAKRHALKLEITQAQEAGDHARAGAIQYGELPPIEAIVQLRDAITDAAARVLDQLGLRTPAGAVAETERDQARAEAARKVDPADLRALNHEMHRTNKELMPSFDWEVASVRSTIEWARQQPTQQSRTHNRDGHSL